MKKWLLIFLGCCLLIISMACFNYGIYFAWLAATPMEPEPAKDAQELGNNLTLAGVISFGFSMLLIISALRKKPPKDKS